MYTRWSCPLCRTAIVLSAVILIVAVPPSVAFALTFTTIDVPGARLTQASGINNRGQIVGWYDDASGGEHGFLLDETGFTTIDVPGAGLTATDGINDRNQIVGGYIGPSGILSFLWDAGSFTTIAVPGARETAA